MMTFLGCALQFEGFFCVPRSSGYYTHALLDNFIQVHSPLLFLLHFFLKYCTSIFHSCSKSIILACSDLSLALLDYASWDFHKFSYQALL